MNIKAASAELTTQIAEGQQIIGPNQDVDGFGMAGEGLDYIELIHQPAAGTYLGQMLRFINYHCGGSAVEKRLLNRVLVLSSGGLVARPKTLC